MLRLLSTTWLAVVLAIACSTESTRLIHHRDPVNLTTMQYNVANQGAGLHGSNIANHIAGVGPDFVTMQECSHCDWMLDQLPPRYAATADPESGVAILYNGVEWLPLDKGWLLLGENDDGWGSRVAVWARFKHRVSHHEVDVYSTHWCVPIRSNTDTCDFARHVDYANALIEHMNARWPATATVLAGDLNLFDGTADNLALNTLADAGLIDVLRDKVAPDAVTFEGNSWAPPGRIDYVLATSPVRIISARIEDKVPRDLGSDHHAVVATVEFF